MKKLARDIYKLAWEVEHAERVAARWSRFIDDEGNNFYIPYDLTGKARRMYSPWTRRLSDREGIYNAPTPPELGEAYGITAGVKIAEKLVIFRCDDGRSFALPYDVVGQQRFAWSPWDRSRAKRESIVHIPLTGKIEEMFEMTGSAKTANQVAETILRQMGGSRRLVMMIGAKHFISYGAEEASGSMHGDQGPSLGAVSFKFPNKGAGRPNYVKILLATDDTYTVIFGRIRGYSYKPTERVEGVHAGQLKKLFERKTGLYLSL